MPAPNRPSKDVAGLVLSGGRSVRFGGEKAAALLHGKSLLALAVERLQASCAWVAVNARPHTEAERLAAPLPVLHDIQGDPDGPLAGIRAGLEWALDLGAGFLAVSPCDTPLLPADLFPRLIRTADADRRAAMAMTADGKQPLCAVWPAEALAAVRAKIANGLHPPTWQVLEDIGAVTVTFDNPSDFANINTRDDLARIADRLA